MFLIHWKRRTISDAKPSNSHIRNLSFCSYTNAAGSVCYAPHLKSLSALNILECHFIPLYYRWLWPEALCFQTVCPIFLIFRDISGTLQVFLKVHLDSRMNWQDRWTMWYSKQIWSQNLLKIYVLILTKSHADRFYRPSLLSGWTCVCKTYASEFRLSLLHRPFLRHCCWFWLLLLIISIRWLRLQHVTSHSGQKNGRKLQPGCCPNPYIEVYSPESNRNTYID